MKGFEPSCFTLQTWCFSQLSHIPIIKIKPEITTLKLVPSSLSSHRVRPQGFKIYPPSLSKRSTNIATFFSEWHFSHPQRLLDILTPLLSCEHSLRFQRLLKICLLYQTLEPCELSEFLFIRRCRT